MNQNLILRIVGVILCIEALCMIPPLLLSVFGGGPDQRAFLYALLICGGVGVLLSLIRADNTRLQTRDGFDCVALCWIALSVFGALPYFFSGSDAGEAKMDGRHGHPRSHAGAAAQAQ